MYIICFYWQGDRWNQEVKKDSQPHLQRVGSVSNELASRYVNNLYYGVKRFTPIDFNFICFTNEKLDLDQNIETRNFPIIGSGVLPRLFMFSKESGLFNHQVLSIDIDTVITGSLKDIVNYNGYFCTRKSFQKSEDGLLDGDIISFYACQYNEDRFYKPFKQSPKNVEKLTDGRERLWVRHVTNNVADTWDQITPNQIVSYKRDVRKKGLPKNARIVSFHGFPRPDQAKEDWIKNYWQ